MMMFSRYRQVVLCCSLVAVLLLTGCMNQPLRDVEQLHYPSLDFQLPAVDRVVLDNGIHLYLKEDKELPLVQMTAMIGSGAMCTPAGKAGFAGLFGATWRSGGAGDRGPEELDEYLDQLAADLSASLGPYSAELDLSLRTQDLQKGVALLADMLRRPAFAEKRLELARLQAQEAVRRQNDNPGSISRRLLMAALYSGHYLGQVATRETLAAITRQDLVNFQQAYFTPGNLWIAVSGDFDRQELVGMLNSSFGDWDQREVLQQPLPPVSRPQSGSIQLVARELPQTTIVVGDLGLTKDHPGQYAASVLNYILGGGGFNSRLMREIRSNRGLAYSAYSYFQVGRRLPGPFVAGTETKTASVIPALLLTREIMDNLRHNLVSEEELKLAKESLINSFVFGFENTHSVVSRQMSQDFFGYPEDYLARYRERVAAVTAVDVQRAAREYIDPFRQQIVLVGDVAGLAGELETFHLPIKEVDLEE